MAHQSSDETPRQLLREIVAHYNATAWSEPARFRGLLMDLCGENQKYFEPQINILVEVLVVKVVDDLQKSSQLSVPAEVLIPRFTQRLRAKGFDENLARWGVESWAMALGIIPPSELSLRLDIENVGNTPFDWRVLGATVRGALHVQSNKPNQDAILWKQGNQSGLPLALAIADGHGGEKYIRSDIGAQLAVKIAIEEIDAILLQLPFPIKNFPTTKQLLTEELPKYILTRWQKEVEEHREDHHPSIEEWEILRKKEHAPTFAEIANNPKILYEAALLAVLITPSFIFYLQLGDGDIVVVSESGQSIRPIPFDNRLVVDKPTSLCSTTLATIQDDFRMQFRILNSPLPALIMLSSDGYSNSFTMAKGILKAGIDIFERLREDGIDNVNDNLNGWLKKTSE